MKNILLCNNAMGIGGVETVILNNNSEIASASAHIAKINATSIIK